MARIFLALALFAWMLLAANFIVGLTIGDFGAASRGFQSARQTHEQLREEAASRPELERAKQAREAAFATLSVQRGRFWPHFWLGILAALINLLVNSISITYFIGTNRWCREVVEAFNLDEQLAQRSHQLKRNAFPPALIGALFVIAISGLGAAADPSGSNQNPADWVVYHWVLAMLGVVAVAACFAAQALAIGKNYELINEILREAEAERERRKQIRERESTAEATATDAAG